MAPQGPYIIRNKGLKTVIDLAGVPPVATIRNWTYNGGNNQLWIATGGIKRWQFINFQYPHIYLAVDVGTGCLVPSNSPWDWDHINIGQIAALPCKFRDATTKKYASGGAFGDLVKLSDTSHHSEQEWLFQLMG